MRTTIIIGVAGGSGSGKITFRKQFIDIGSYAEKGGLYVLTQTSECDAAQANRRNCRAKELFGR